MGLYWDVGTDEGKPDEGGAECISPSFSRNGDDGVKDCARSEWQPITPE